MADHSGPSNVTSGNDPDIDMQGTSDREDTTTSKANNGSSAPLHGPDCLTPRCFRLLEMNEDQQWHLGLEEIESYFPDPPQGTSQGENNLEPAQGHSEDDNNLQSEVVSRNALTTAAPATKDDTQVGSVKLGTDNVLMGMNADGNLSINSPGHSSSEAQNLDNPQQVTAEYNDQRRRATRLNPRSFNAGVSAPFDSGVGSIPNHQNLDNPRQVTAANNNQGRRTARNETDPKFFHDGASDPFDFSGGMPPSQAYAPDNFASHDPLAEALGRTDQGHISGIPPSLEEADPLGVTSPVVEQHTLTNNDAVVQSGETIPSPSGAVQASSNDQVPEPMSGVMMQASATQASATQASATTTNVAFKTEPSEPTGNLSFAPAGNIDPDEVQPSAEPGSSSRHTSSNPQATTLPQSDVRNTSMTPRNNIRAFPVVLTSLVIPKGISLPGQHFDVPTKDMGQMYQPIDKPVGQPSQPYDVSTKDLGQIPQVPDKHMKLSSQLSSISTEDFSQNQEAANKEPSPLDQLYDVPTGDFEQEYQLLDTQLCQPGDLYDVPTNDFGQSYRPVDKQLSLPDQSYSVSTEDFGPKYHQAVDMRMGAPGRLYGISTEGFGQKYQPVDQQLSLPGPRHGVPTENFGQTYQPAAERLSLSGQQQYGHSTEDLGQNYQTIYEQMSVSGQPYGAYTEDFGQNNQAADHVVPPEAFGQNYEAAEPMGFSGQLYAPPNEDFGQIYPRTHEQLVVSGQLYALTGDIGQNYQAVGKQTWNLPQPQFDESSLRNRSSMKEGFLRAGSSTSYPAASISDFPASATDDRNAAINDNSENETTAAQDTIGTPETVNDDTYTNLFSDWNAVVAYENQREPNPEYDQDQTVPQTDVEHQIYVRLIVQAILDISNTRDYPAESAARGLKPPQAYVNFRENKYSDIEIQILAWKILMKCKEKQKNGYLVPQRRGGRKPVTHEIFQELVNEICQSLSEQKTICKRLLDAEFLSEFIDNPGAQLKRAAQNKRLNENKAVQIAAGRNSLAETDERKRQRPLTFGEDVEGDEQEMVSSGQGEASEGAGALLPPTGATSAHREPQTIDPRLAGEPVQGFDASGNGVEGAGAQPQSGEKKRGRGASMASREEPRRGKRRRS